MGDAEQPPKGRGGPPVERTPSREDRQRVTTRRRRTESAGRVPRVQAPASAPRSESRLRLSSSRLIGSRPAAMRDTAYLKTAFGPPRPLPRRTSTSALKRPRPVVRGMEKHLRRRSDAGKVTRKSTGMHKGTTAKNAILEARKARKAKMAQMAQIAETIEEHDEEDDEEEAVPPPDELAAFSEHGGDEPGSGSPPGITA